MSRADERTNAQQLLLTALRSTPGVGMTEGVLREMTNLGSSLFQEAMNILLAIPQVVVIKQGGPRNLSEYHLVQQLEWREPHDGPLSPLAITVLDRLSIRAEGIRALVRALNIELSLVQQALDELESAGQISRSQVGMLVIYRGISST